MVTKYKFHHNLTEATKQKTYLTKAVKEYALMMEMLCRPLNMESFGHKMFILSQQFLYVHVDLNIANPHKRKINKV